MWRQLQPVSIPTFSGDKAVYEWWKATFTCYIDEAPIAAEYKLLQLRQYLSGEALQCVEELGHSAIAYEAAKKLLDRKYGGERRKSAVIFDKLECIKLVQYGNAKQLEDFADALDISITKLKAAGREEELGDGHLFSRLQRKLDERLLSHDMPCENRINSEDMLQEHSFVDMWMCLEYNII